MGNHGEMWSSYACLLALSVGLAAAVSPPHFNDTTLVALVNSTGADVLAVYDVYEAHPEYVAVLTTTGLYEVFPNERKVGRTLFFDSEAVGNGITGGNPIPNPRTTAVTVKAEGRIALLQLDLINFKQLCTMPTTLTSADDILWLPKRGDGQYAVLDAATGDIAFVPLQCGQPQNGTLHNNRHLAGFNGAFAPYGVDGPSGFGEHIFFASGVYNGTQNVLRVVAVDPLYMDTESVYDLPIKGPALPQLVVSSAKGASPGVNDLFVVYTENDALEFAIFEHAGSPKLPFVQLRKGSPFTFLGSRAGVSLAAAYTFDVADIPSDQLGLAISLRVAGTGVVTYTMGVNVVEHTAVWKDSSLINGFVAKKGASAVGAGMGLYVVLAGEESGALAAVITEITEPFTVPPFGVSTN